MVERCDEALNKLEKCCVAEEEEAALKAEEQLQAFTRLGELSEQIREAMPNTISAMRPYAQLR